MSASNLEVLDSSRSSSPFGPDINESRTPPTVRLSVTPTSGKEFNYHQNPPLVLSAERFKDVSNLKVNQRRSRSFTPVKNAMFLRSPELSPIRMKQSTPNGNTQGSTSDALTPGQFKIPHLLIKSSKNTTPTGPSAMFHHQGGKRIGTPIVRYMEDPNQTHSLDKSASHGYLNHKLDVCLILKNASLQQYTKAFMKENIDFERFLSLCEEDLIRLGVKRKVDRKVLASIINDFNSN